MMIRLSANLESETQSEATSQKNFEDLMGVKAKELGTLKSWSPMKPRRARRTSGSPTPRRSSRAPRFR